MFLVILTTCPAILVEKKSMNIKFIKILFVYHSKNVKIRRRGKKGVSI